MPNASDSDDEQQPVAVEAPGQLDNSELPALFWDTMPEDAEQHPDYAALQALRDEATPEERAETYKVRSGCSPHSISTAPAAPLDTAVHPKARLSLSHDGLHAPTHA